MSPNSGFFFLLTYAEIKAFNWLKAFFLLKSAKKKEPLEKKLLNRTALSRHVKPAKSPYFCARQQKKKKGTARKDLVKKKRYVGTRKPAILLPKPELILKQMVLSNKHGLTSTSVLIC